MRTKLLLTWLVGFVCCGLLDAQAPQTCTPGANMTCTTNLDLWLPGPNYQNWNVPLVFNFQILDSKIATLGPGTITGVQAGTSMTGGGTTGLVYLGVAPTGVTAGNYTNANISVNAQGQITAAANGSGGGGGGSITGVTAGAGLSGGGTTGDVTLAITPTAVTPGSYTNTNLTVNALGQITAATNGSSTGGGTISGVIAGTGLTGGGSTGSVTLGIAPTAVTAGTYANPTLTVNAEGQLTDVSSGSGGGGNGTITGVTAGTGLTGGGTIGTVSLGITPTAVTAGSYSNPNITVNAQGQITAAANGSGAGVITGVPNGAPLLNNGGQIGSAANSGIVVYTAAGFQVGLPFNVSLTGSINRGQLVCFNNQAVTQSCGTNSPYWTGVATSNATTGNAAVYAVLMGYAMCTFDSATTPTVGHVVVVSSTIQGDCHDAGPLNGTTNTFPAQAGSAQVGFVTGGTFNIFDPSTGTSVPAPGNTWMILLTPASAINTLNALSDQPGGGVGLGTITGVTAGIGLTGGGTVGNVSLGIGNTGVAAGSYTSANITVNPQGQVVAASNGAGSSLTLLVSEVTSAHAPDKICAAVAGINGSVACGGVTGTPVSILTSTGLTTINGDPPINTAGLTGSIAQLGITTNTTSTVSVLWPTTISRNYDTAQYFRREQWFVAGQNLPSMGNFEVDNYNFDKTNQLEQMFGWQCNTHGGHWQYSNFTSGWINTTVPCSIIATHNYHWVLTTHVDPPTSTACTLAGTPGPCNHFDTFLLEDQTPSAPTSNTYALNLTVPTETVAYLGSNYSTWQGIGSQVQIDAEPTSSASQLVSMWIDGDTFSAYNKASTTQASLTTIVGALPACTEETDGVEAEVSDATAPTYLGVAVGGGNVQAPVLCNGTNWVTY